MVSVNHVSESLQQFSLKLPLNVSGIVTVQNRTDLRCFWGPDGPETRMGIGERRRGRRLGRAVERVHLKFMDQEFCCLYPQQEPEPEPGQRGNNLFLHEVKSGFAVRTSFPLSEPKEVPFCTDLIREIQTSAILRTTSEPLQNHFGTSSLDGNITSKFDDKIWLLSWF